MKLRIAMLVIIGWCAAMLLADARPGWLGFGFTLHTEASQQWLHVRTIADGGPAAQAGLRQGDLIVAIDGKPLRFQDDLAVLERLGTVKPQQTVTVTVARADTRLRLRLKAAPMSDARWERWQLNLEVAKQKRAQAQR
jgi:S1-C subfamily serine protease